MHNPLLVIALFVISFSNAQADDVSDFFNSIAPPGSTTTSTTPGMFKGQTMNHYVGGSASIRIPQKTYQIASFSPPQMPKAGCGGIDMYAGAFSFIDADQLVEMLQNIGNNAQGAIFKLAIDTVSPQLGGVIDYFNDLAQKINSLNINSCEAATGVVNAAADVARGNFTTALSGTASSQISSIYDDFAGAWTKIKGNISKRKEARELAKNSPETKDKLANVNITWEALKNQRIGNGTGINLTNEQMRLMMSIFGTVICDNKGTDSAADDEADRTCLFYQPLTEDLPQKIVFGEEFKVFGQGCDKSGSDESKACLTERYLDDPENFEFVIDGRKFESFEQFIQEEMTFLKDQISSRVAVTDAARLKRIYQFINMSSVPAWTLIKLASIDGMGNAYYEQASKAIAADIAFNFFALQGQTIRSAINREKASSKYFATEADEKEMNKQIESVERVISRFDSLKENQRKALSEISTVSASIGQISAMYNQRMASIR